MPSFNNPILWLKSGVQTKPEKQLRQMEDKLFDLEGQLVVLAQIMLFSLEEKHTLATLQGKEEKMMRQA